MRVMAGITVSISKRSVGLLQFPCLPGFPMAVKTQFRVFGIEELLILCCVRRMTGEASFATLYGFMDNTDLSPHLFVTVKTEGVAALENKFWKLRGMGLMAGITHSFFERRMVHRPSRPHVFRIMAIGTKFILVLTGLKRFGRRSGFMTTLALGRRNRVMGARLQELRLQGGMGVMTTRAFRLTHRIIPMGLFKRSLGAVVASKAKRSFSLQQQVLLVGTVRGMASGAAFCCLEGLMNNLLLKNLFLMTQETGLIALCFHQVASLRSMGVMAEDAFASTDCCMNLGFI